MTASVCPVCAHPSGDPFVEIDGLPVHVGVLWRTAADAIAAPRSPMRMQFCPGCGYVWNGAFDPNRLDYEQDYDNALHGSALFRDFEAAMVAHLVERYDLDGRTIVEVGCGDGRFLGLLCNAGDNRGVGFEPGYRPERRAANASDRVDILPEPYTADHPRRVGDLVATRQVLEHIADPVGFLRTIRRGIGDGNSPLYVDVPNGAEPLEELAVWDLMYEHCGYYIEPTLRFVAETAGFAVTDVYPAHSGQFLVLEAEPATRGANSSANVAPADEPALAAFADHVSRFGAVFGRRVAEWRERLVQYADEGSTVVAWGAGARAVSFFNAVGIGSEVAALVDLNPRKQGTFLAGTGHEIISPDQLPGLDPDVVIVVNRVYADEIRSDLNALGLVPKVEMA